MEKTWQALIKTEKQLHRHFKQLRSALPAIARTPEPGPVREYQGVQKDTSHFGGLLNNLNSPSPHSRLFSEAFKQKLYKKSVLPARDVVCQPRPLAWKVLDPHTKSHISVGASGSPKRKLESGFKSIAFISPISSRSHSCERGGGYEDAGHVNMKVKRREIRKGKKPQINAGVGIDASESIVLENRSLVFPFRERKPTRKLKHLDTYEPLHMLDYMIREQAFKRANPLKRLRANSKAKSNNRMIKLEDGVRDEELKSHEMFTQLRLSDDSDEDKCVVEGAYLDPIVHLPKY